MTMVMSILTRFGDKVPEINICAAAMTQVNNDYLLGWTFHLQFFGGYGKGEGSICICHDIPIYTYA